jgi:hypothetical protein
MGGRQATLGLSVVSQLPAGTQHLASMTLVRSAPLPARLDTDQITAHTKFIENLGDKALWLEYVKPEVS